jgi:hypothetical protein
VPSGTSLLAGTMYYHEDACDSGRSLYWEEERNAVSSFGSWIEHSSEMQSFSGLWVSLVLFECLVGSAMLISLRSNPHWYPATATWSGSPEGDGFTSPLPYFTCFSCISFCVGVATRSVDSACRTFSAQ